MAKSVECKCTDSFTCRHCLDNRKPWVFTPSKTPIGTPKKEENKNG